MARPKNIGVASEVRCEHNSRDKDIEWLASLSEHELDFLISLKELATVCAKNIGHKDLTQKFDIKVLRALAFILLEYFKDRVKNTLVVQSEEILGSLSGCGLLNLNSDGSASKSSTKNVSFVSSRRKRMWDGLQEGSSSNKKQKNQ